MEIDIARGAWKGLQGLRREILDGERTTRVKTIEKLLIKTLAATLAVERPRNGEEGGVSGLDEMVVSLELTVRPCGRKSDGPETPRGEVSLIAQLDEALAEKKAREELLSW